MRLLPPLFFLALSLGASPVSLAQNADNDQRYRLPIRRATGRIVLDGKLTEAAWKSARPARNFWQQFPYDTLRAGKQTEVRLTYDQQNLYIGIVAFQQQQYVIPSLRRDFATSGHSDAVLINIDTFRDKQTAFQFAVNPYGVEREGLVSNGDHFSTDWDNRWTSRVTNLNDRWIVEIAIPFKTLRYRAEREANQWGINFFRYNLADNERSCWAPIPRGFNSSDLAFSGTLVWDQQPPQPGKNMAFIPYVLADVERDYVRDIPAQPRLNAGFDAKVSLTPSLNLDLTVNPDFAQVEVDQQVTNLSRFELYFPERRQFFVENADLFGSFGFSKAKPFFSRRIGLVRSPVSDELERNAIHAGLRLSGKLNDRWRVGLLNVQTAEDASLGIRTANFTVATAQYRVFSRSTIGGIVVNKIDRTGYNTVVGADYNLASPDGIWQGKFFYHKLLRNQNRSEQFVAGARLDYSTKRFNAETENEIIGRHYTPDVGFVPRRGIVRTINKASYTYFPKNDLRRTINAISFGPEVDVVYGTTQQRLLDWEAGLYGRVKFQNTASLKFTFLRWEYVYLFSPFDPSGKNDPERQLPAGSSYRYAQAKIQYQSDSRQLIYGTIESRFGQYYNGQLVNLHGTLHYRHQPFASVALEVNYNRIRLPDGYNDADLWLIGPRADLTFTRNLYLTTFVQYNNQVNNLNINARLQWRFKPVSDFYLVYTNNYFTQATTLSEARYFEPFRTRDRALVAKLTYWFSL
ncbi:carbohydrate binding family 9 domain-containing protein [Spirosoma montaniterrae]|uniref:Uncharacterized protein n=1 Tax=Spirosoma montaniterrae TaxID=1178516 RepID=A0A1P9WTD3_9BACT|nr:carbohydrate binding family 9 domain-containing protein [Spirosoma montaniterrae]AQG78641.1 hypothetical protein AWR27_04395 [Spirosoma montaniterrae]